MQAAQKVDRPPSAPSPAAQFAAEGAEARGIDAMQRTDFTVNLRHDLSTVFDTVDTLIKELDRGRAALGQRSLALGLEREAHHELKARHRNLTSEHERLIAEVAAAKMQIQRHTTLIAEHETAHAGLRQSLAEKTRSLGDLTLNMEAAELKMAHLLQELTGLRDRFEAADMRAFQLETELGATRDALSLADAETRKRDIEITDLRKHVARVTLAHDEATQLTIAVKGRLAELSAELDAKHAEHVSALDLLQAETEGRRTDVTAMQKLVEALQAQVAAIEQSHSEASRALEERIEERNLLEKLLREQQQTGEVSQRGLQASEKELAKSRARAAELETASAALNEHTDGLAKSLQARERESAGYKNKLDAANERIRAEAQRFENDRAALAQHVARLTARLEQEQLSRAMAEGALEAARKERQAPVRATPALTVVSSQETPQQPPAPLLAREA